MRFLRDVSIAALILLLTSTISSAQATATPGDELLEYICQENNQYGVETLPGGLPPADTTNSGRK